MIQILAILYAIISITYVCYLAITNAMRVRAEITWPVWVLLGPIVVVGVAADFILNIIVGTLLFLDIPKEPLFTARLKRYREGPDGTRKKTACFICEKLLNIFDPTKKHC